MANIHDTINERGKVHGDFEKQAARGEAILHAIMSDADRNDDQWRNLRPFQRHALTMIATKLSRIMEGNAFEPDHWRDISGYATLVLDRLTKDPEPE